MAKIKYNNIFKTIGIILYFFRYKYTQFWSTHKIEKYQFSRLHKQLVQANKTSYYRKLFKEINFNPNIDFKNLSDLKKIPITNKKIVKENSKLFINKDFEGISLPFYTSGSTGSPIKALIHPIHWIIEQSLIFRHWSWGGYRFRDSTAMLRSYSPKDGGPLTMYSKPLNTTYFSPFHLSDKNMMYYYNLMKNLKVKILRGYPSSIKIFSLFLQKNNLKLKSVKQILVASEVLNDNDRELIESVFDCKISNHYGLAEQIVMFGDCENHTHLHNYFEYGYVELLDTDKFYIKKIIGTNLHNKTMPIIRYETGDLAIVDDSNCDCKRNGITIKNIIGRNDNSVECPDKSKIPTVNFYTMLEDYIEISNWQIIYNSQELSLNYISNNTISNQRINELKKRLVQRVKHTGFKIKINKVKDLQKTIEGKLKTIIRL